MIARHETTNYKRLLPYMKQAKACDKWYRKFTAPGCMPLTVEYSGATDERGDDVYYISHTFEQNGDLMRDPEMMVAVNDEDGTVRPLVFSNDLVGLEQEVYMTQNIYRPRLMKELDDFLWQWLKNLKSQGFDPEIMED